MGRAKAGQIPGGVFVDLTFRIKVQGPKLALAHIVSRFRAGGNTLYYSIVRHRSSYSQANENEWLSLVFEFFSPVCDHRNRGRTGPFQGNVDGEPLTVRGSIVEVPGLGNRACLEQHLRRGF